MIKSPSLSAVYTAQCGLQKRGYTHCMSLKMLFLRSWSTTVWSLLRTTGEWDKSDAQICGKEQPLDTPGRLQPWSSSSRYRMGTSLKLWTDDCSRAAQLNGHFLWAVHILQWQHTRSRWPVSSSSNWPYLHPSKSDSICQKRWGK